MLVIRPASAPLDPTRAPTAEQAAVRRLLFLDLREAGFWIASRGFMALSLPVTEQDRDRFIATFDRFLVDRAYVLEHLQDKASGTSVPPA